MKRRFFSIYSKVFFYTLIILVFAICVTMMFFANQIGSVIERAQQEQLADIFSPLVDELKGKSDEAAVDIAKSFHVKNTAFAFSLSSKDGEIVYQTDNFEPSQMHNDIPDLEDVLSSQNHSPGLSRRQYKFTSHNGSDGYYDLS